MNTHDLHDVNLYITLYKNFIPRFQGEVSKMRDAKKKTYLWLSEAKIDELAKEISLDPAEFAKNLIANSNVYKVPRRVKSPSNIAEKYKCTRYSSVLEVLVNTCSLIGDKMAAHPLIRKFVLEKYMKGLRVSTNPTEKGESELDCFHPSYRIKRLKIVPIDKLQDETWLEILRAKERGLIEYTFEHDKVLFEIMDKMKELYLDPDPTARYEEDWATFFNEIIDRVCTKLLRPDLEKRAKQDLKEKSVEYVVGKIKENFCKDYLMVPPYLFQKKA